MGNSKRGEANLVIYPGCDNRASGDRRCQTNDSPVSAAGQYYGNRCLSGDSRPYSWAGCNPSDTLNTTYASLHDNTFWAPGGNFTVSCGGQELSLAQWQATGQDAGASLGDVPSIGQLVTEVTDLLFGTFRG